MLYRYVLTCVPSTISAIQTLKIIMRKHHTFQVTILYLMDLITFNYFLLCAIYINFPLQKMLPTLKQTFSIHILHTIISYHYNLVYSLTKTFKNLIILTALNYKILVKT